MKQETRVCQNCPDFIRALRDHEIEDHDSEGIGTRTTMTEPQTKQCQNCHGSFVIEPDDFAFYEKIHVPPPTSPAASS